MEQSTRVDGKMSVGKKVVAAVLLLTCAPFVVPSLVVASTIVLISSLPYCFVLASYVFTEKLMRTLLPCTDKLMLFRDKTRVAMSEPVLVVGVYQSPEDDQDMTKVSESLLESIRDEVEGAVFYSGASTGKDMEKSANEVEEQIWAKMEALRKIVGYTVVRSTAYSEELKSLYMFTGVELPASMLEKEDDQDITQVSERLCFLMSVIGIK